jgi:hypothetical protein
VRPICGKRTTVASCHHSAPARNHQASPTCPSTGGCVSAAIADDPTTPAALQRARLCLTSRRRIQRDSHIIVTANDNDHNTLTTNDAGHNSYRCGGALCVPYHDVQLQLIYNVVFTYLSIIFILEC